LASGHTGGPLAPVRKVAAHQKADSEGKVAAHHKAEHSEVVKDDVKSSTETVIMVAAHQKAETVDVVAGPSADNDMEIDLENVSDSASNASSASDVESTGDGSVGDSEPDNDDFQVQRSKRHNKRPRISSDSEQTQMRQTKTHSSNAQRPLTEQTARTVYIKGRKCNLAKSLELVNVRSFKRSISEITGPVESIDCKGDSVRIVCRTDTQRQTLLCQTQIDGKDVSVSVPWSMEKRDKGTLERQTKQPQWVKGVVTSVPLDLSMEDVKEETGAIWAHRLTKRTKHGIVPTMAVIIAYENDLPKTVNIGFVRYRVSVYIPNPIRCAKCQRYGHKAARCWAEKPRCPKCAQSHTYETCTASADEIKCANCGEEHSSAYKGCKKYKNVSGALKLVVTQQMSYRDALKQTMATASGTVEKPDDSASVNATAATAGESGTRPIVKRKSVETQTDEPQQNTGQIDKPSDSDMTGEQMVTLIKTTADALLWLIESLQTTSEQTDIVRKLTSALKVIDLTTQRQDKHPTAVAVTGAITGAAN